jgi:hypothetical protein
VWAGRDHITEATAPARQNSAPARKR